MGMIDISGLNKAEVLAVLYNSSQAQGMGLVQSNPKTLTIEEAQGLLAKQSYFDYLKGRVLKVELSGDTLCSARYDRDNGIGAAERAISRMRPAVITP